MTVHTALSVQVPDKRLINKHFLVLALATLMLLLTGNASAGNVSGSLNKWAPITIDFSGPSAEETDNAPNPFLDYRLNVVFTSPAGNVYQVPGFFAGDGQGGGSGNQWRVRFSADETGQWRYQANLVSGSQIAINTDLSTGQQVNIENASGEFFVQPQSGDAPGFLSVGRLEYIGQHYLKFRDGPYWIKSGTDSPENFLGYAGIDGTVDQGGSNFLHDYSTHRGDARGDDPVFSNASSGADSLGITGALNYLSDQGVNSIYFLPMNLGGDGQETYPFVGGTKTSFNKTHYDISKLYQWNLVLNHAQRRGIALNIVLSETEPGNERWLDDGKLGVERKLFFRELIARFGYLLAAKWNLGEENDFPVSELRAHAQYLNTLDWTKKPIAVHTQINNFRDYEELVGDDLFSASSIQYDPPRADEFVETWRKRSADAGRPWVIDMDENTGGITNANATTRRKQILYDVYFSGGNLEWYYGYHPLPLGGDINAGDFRQRDAIWTTMRHARNFMQSQLPFWRMQPADNLVSGEDGAFGGAEVFAAPGEIYAIYLPNASGNPSLDLRSASGSFSQRWFNPRNGQFAGDEQTVVGGSQLSLGSPPSSSNDDWVVLVKSHNAEALPDFTVAQTPVATEPAATNDQSLAETANDQNAETQAPEQTGDDASGDSQIANNEELTDEVVPPPPEPAPVNEPPSFLALEELPPAIPGELYNLSVIATDPDGVAPVITAETLPAGMRFNRVADGVAAIEWQVPASVTEAVTFDIVAIDVLDNNLRATLTVTIPVILGETTSSDSPTQQELPDSEANANSTQTDNADNADTIDTEAQNSQENNQAVESDNNANVVVDVSGTDLPPIIVGAQNKQLLVGQTLKQTIVPVDPEGIVASLRLDTDTGNILFSDNGNGSRELTWTPTESDIGTHELRFIATDSGITPHVVQQVMQIEVMSSGEGVPDDQNSPPSVNFEPIFVPIDNLEVREGDQISFIVNAIDPNGNPPILHVNAPPEGAVFSDNGDGTRTFGWNVPENAAENIQLEFVATDTDDLSVTVEQQVVIRVIR